MEARRVAGVLGVGVVVGVLEDMMGGQVYITFGVC